MGNYVPIFIITGAIEVELLPVPLPKVEDSARVPDSDSNDVDEQLLLDDYSHVPGPGVLR